MIMSAPLGLPGCAASDAPDAPGEVIAAESFLADIARAVAGPELAVKGLLPPEATAEMWQWMYLGPMFVVSGALAALVTLELDWGTAVAHFSLYAMFTALLRWLIGLPPL